MSRVVRVIVWAPRPRVYHFLDGWIESQYGRRRVASIIQENDNPLKARGSAPLTRPFTLELYIPVPSGTDKVQKFLTLQAAQNAATLQLERFVADALCRTSGGNR